MICRALLTGVLALVVLSVGAPPAAGDVQLRSALHYLGRDDPRLCPSPMCGGAWIKPVNGADFLRCSDPVGQECYVAHTTIGTLPLPAARRDALSRRFEEGRAIALGHIVQGQVEGFPRLGVLQVSGVWETPSLPARARGTFYLVRDNGIRCVTTPCFSVTAAKLDTEREIRVSQVDLSSANATPAQRRRAHREIASKRGLIVAGRIVRAEDGGRVLRGFQFYFRAYP